MDTQIAVLVSTAKSWISAPDTETSISLGLLGMMVLFWAGTSFCCSLRQLPVAISTHELVGGGGKGEAFVHLRPMSSRGQRDQQRSA